VVDPVTTEAYLKREAKRSKDSQITLPCINNCTDPCGICPGDSNIVKNSIQAKEENNLTEIQPPKKPPDPSTYRMLFSFSKLGKGVFISHLGTVELFSMALIRTGMPVLYTKGFNPLIHLEFASPVSLGINCTGEIASVDLEQPFKPEEFTALINEKLPEGFTVQRAEFFTIPTGAKKHSLSSLLWGFQYGETSVTAKEEKTFRLSRHTANTNLVRTGILANLDNGPGDYFNVYSLLYKSL
jgi:hypothetical protein